MMPFLVRSEMVQEYYIPHRCNQRIRKLWPSANLPAPAALSGLLRPEAAFPSYVI